MEYFGYFRFFKFSIHEVQKIGIDNLGTYLKSNVKAVQEVCDSKMYI